MIGATLYPSALLSQVAAIDAAPGKAKWVFDPKVYDNGLGIPPNDGWLHSRVAYWRSGEEARVVILTAFAHMIALAAKTGMPVARGLGWRDFSRWRIGAAFASSRPCRRDRQESRCDARATGDGRASLRNHEDAHGGDALPVQDVG